MSRPLFGTGSESSAAFRPVAATPPVESAQAGRLQAIGLLPRTVDSTQQIAAAIEEAIRAECKRRVRDLRVTVAGDTITIAGRAASYYAKQLAQCAAMRLAERRQVENQLEVW